MRWVNGCPRLPCSMGFMSDCLMWTRRWWLSDVGASWMIVEPLNHRKPWRSCINRYPAPGLMDKTPLVCPAYLPTCLPPPPSFTQMLVLLSLPLLFTFTSSWPLLQTIDRFPRRRKSSIRRSQSLKLWRGVNISCRRKLNGVEPSWVWGGARELSILHGLLKTVKNYYVKTTVFILTVIQSVAVLYWFVQLSREVRH